MPFGSNVKGKRMLAQPSVSQNEAESGSDEETGKTAQHTDYFAYEINKTENASAAFSYSVSLDFDQPVDILADIEDKNVTIEDVAYTLYHIHTDEEGNQAVSEIVPDVNFQDRNIYGFSFTTADFSTFVLKYTVTYIIDDRNRDLRRQLR